MDNNFHGDIKINGSGSAGGGTYNSVIIKGTGKINGDLKCNIFSLGGTGSVEGNLEVADGKINGTGTIEGDLKAGKFKMNGTGKITGNIVADEFAVSGSGSFLKNIEAQNVKVEGAAKIGQDCNAEVFTSDGSFEVGGLLNADEINIRLLGFKSRAREIGGGKITVSIGPPHGLGVFKTIVSMGILNPLLEADTIEGDEIVLENTTAAIVRGNNITIGAGCDIGTVEYTGHYVKTGDARVGTETKI